MVTTLDLSRISDRLIELLEGAVTSSALWTTNGGTVTPFTLDVNALMPEAARNLGNCQLSMYLFHVSPSTFTRSMPLTSTSAQGNARQPLGLDLFYLLTAFSKDHPEQEQQAMSIAIKALHERSTYIDPSNGLSLTVTLESEKHDEANRRWQSYSTPFRLSTVYRVGVAFLTPRETTPRPAPPPRRIGLAAGTVPMPFALAGSLVSTASSANFEPVPATPDAVIVYDYTPAVVAPGGSFVVFGTGLAQPTTSRFYLIEADGTEREITAWKGSAAQNNESRVVFTLPAAVGGIPANAPAPGVYLMRAGSSVSAGDSENFRTNAVPLTVTAAITPVASPWNAAGGIFTFTGRGFVAGATELLLDTVTLNPAAGASPNAGEFVVNAAGTSVAFRVPAGIPAGTYFVRVRVRGVEGAPVGRVTVT
jgi:hypothetical protein